MVLLRAIARLLPAREGVSGWLAARLTSAAFNCARRAGSTGRSHASGRSELKVPLLVAATALLAGCASFPNGPSVMVLPGSARTWDQFQVDDADCRNYSSAVVGGKNANQAAADSTAKSAAIGTAVGAAAGALIGGNAAGAGVGAGIGLLGGTAIGADAGNASGRSLQQRYDVAFTQCMYAKGHQVPIARGAYPRPRYSSAAPPPPTSSATPPLPPPPAGAPPPPPSGYRVN